jgi:hypothetical protein
MPSTAARAGERDSRFPFDTLHCTRCAACESKQYPQRAASGQTDTHTTHSQVHKASLPDSAIGATAFSCYARFCASKCKGRGGNNTSGVDMNNEASHRLSALMTTRRWQSKQSRQHTYRQRASRVRQNLRHWLANNTITQKARLYWTRPTRCSANPLQIRCNEFCACSGYAAFRQEGQCAHGHPTVGDLPLNIHACAQFPRMGAQR